MFSPWLLIVRVKYCISKCRKCRNIKWSGMLPVQYYLIILMGVQIL